MYLQSIVSLAMNQYAQLWRCTSLVCVYVYIYIYIFLNARVFLWIAKTFQIEIRVQNDWWCHRAKLHCLPPPLPLIMLAQPCTSCTWSLANSLMEEFLTLQFKTTFTSITNFRKTKRWCWQTAFRNTLLRAWWVYGPFWLEVGFCT